MTQVASIIDILLWVLVATSLSIILYKTLDLWAPALINRDSIQDRLVGLNSAEVDEELESIEEGVHYLAIFSSASPFIGLAGTVMHIVHALQNMQNAGLDISVISGPIATALTATLVGLASALPSMIAYNLMTRKLQVEQNKAYRRLNSPSTDSPNSLLIQVSDEEGH